MILHEFPDLTWLQSQASTGFTNRMGWGNRMLDTEGFPSVIIDTHTNGCFRPDIKGPFSFFLNIHGSSKCSVDRQTTYINEEHYFVSNRAQLYTLQIEEPADTFNIHFGDAFSESVLNALITPADQVLSNGTEKQQTPFAFFNQLHRRDAVFNSLVDAIRRSYQEQGFNRMHFEEQLAALLSYHLLQHRHIVDSLHRLPPIRQTTRVELYKRLSRARDLLHSCFTADRPCFSADLSLDQLSAEACLSKYHFLRLFRQTYGLSPHQYLQNLRLEKARTMLTTSSIPITDLSDLLGFANSQSFSRLFLQRTGHSPSHYRALAK
ncbi:MAG: helix-turn-helix transcriptional regulator [Bacteroidetes bacterium]|nr:helix-turn-helix transcriptional regulator [Bacteroidota bacterium]